MREKTKRQREKETERHYERGREREVEVEAEWRERVEDTVVEAENSLFERPSGNRRYIRLCVCR